MKKALQKRRAAAIRKSQKSRAKSNIVKDAIGRLTGVRNWHKVSPASIGLQHPPPHGTTVTAEQDNTGATRIVVTSPNSSPVTIRASTSFKEP
jgi:hypothetical protein